MSIARQPKVTRADLEAKFRQLQGEVEEKVLDQRTKIIGAVATISVLALVIAYLLGKRKGSRRSTVVEIRRI